MGLKETLLEIDDALVTGGGDAYRRHLVTEAVVIVPGQALDKKACVAAIDASPGWDDFSIEDAQLLELGDDSAAVTYTFTGRRGEDDYSALMTSTYAERDGRWMLVVHQQTPLASP